MENLKEGLDQSSWFSLFEGTENITWMKLLGQVFEFIRSISKPLTTWGGGNDDLRRFLQDPSLGEGVAEVLMGRSKIVQIDPMKVIKETGRSYEVKALAVADIVSEDDLIKVLTLYPYGPVGQAVLDKVSSARLYRFYKEMDRSLMNDLKSGNWSIWKAMFEAMDDSDLLKIALDEGEGALTATNTIEDPTMIKVIIESAKYGICQCAAVGRCNDLPYLESLYKEALKTDPHHTKNWANDLWKRVGELRRVEELRKDVEETA